jgi:hypothetical protein
VHDVVAVDGRLVRVVGDLRLLDLPVGVEMIGNT